MLPCTSKSVGLDRYMEYFAKGLESKAGAILIEGEVNQWLEAAFQSAYRYKAIFESGYRAGMMRSREDGNTFFRKLETE